MRAQPEKVQHLVVEAFQTTSDVTLEEMVPSSAEAHGSVREFTGERPVAGIERGRRLGEGEVESTSTTRCANRLEGGATCGRARRIGSSQASIPRSGDDGTAIPRAGIRPARHAARPEATASRIASAIMTGSSAPAIALLRSTPSTPCSIA